MTSRAPRGRSAYGCVLLLVLLGAGGYFAFNVGSAYLRYFRYRDAMAQEARFAARNSDDVIIERLRAKAESLGLPESARRVHIRRVDDQIYIWADYVETVELPGVVRDFAFEPHVARAF